MTYVEIYTDLFTNEYKMRKITKEEYEALQESCHDLVSAKIDDAVWAEYSAFLAESVLWQEKMCELEQEFYNNQTDDYQFLTMGCNMRYRDGEEEEEGFKNPREDEYPTICRGIIREEK